MRSRKIFIHALLLSMYLLAGMATNAQQSIDAWWPVQAKPRAMLVCEPAGHVRDMNLAQSLAGLAALSLNEGKKGEAVWIKHERGLYETYYQQLLKRTGLKQTAVLSTWDLVKRLRKQGIIQGYILYDIQQADNHINVATVYASLLHGVLIDVKQEAKAKAAGLSLLQDVRRLNWTDSLYDQLAPRLNDSLIVIAQPGYPNNRDYAIAHRAMVYYGVDSLLNRALKRIRPLSPVIGWNKGDEFKQIAPCTREGLINTASDWCMNLAVLSIGADKFTPKQLAQLDPATINWKDTGRFHSFVMSDGDNMQWTMGHFLDDKEYWANPTVSSSRLSFTSCVLNLTQAAPDVYEELRRTQQPQSTVVEYGGGYYYPDLFAIDRPGRDSLLREYAARINSRMKSTGATVFGFICKNVNSKDAQRAYQLYAEEMEGLTGMIAVQYSPYNAGQGKIYWVKNKKGIEIPVVTAHYQLWANLTKKGSGDPATIASLINQPEDNKIRFDWTIVHAWSKFSKDGTSPATRGAEPVKWCVDKLDNKATVVNIEELLWRIRMEHNPEQTQKVIKEKL
jgi:hypothetical protein